LSVSREQWLNLVILDNEEINDKISGAKDELAKNRLVFEQELQNKRKKLVKGDSLPPSVIKVVKVYLAIKRRLKVGDKMAGRHGNKGVISIV